jgi:hypothetical protein
MNLLEKVTAITSSAHTGRALKAAKFLNLLGTVRGAVTTVLLASSAIGGAVTVNNVRQDIAQSQAATTTSRPTTRATPPPTPTPLTATGLRSDAQKRLQSGLDQNAQAADDLRKVSILDATGTDALVAQTRQKLQARFDQALVQIDALLAISTPAPSATPQPSASLSVVAVNSLVQVALGDMNGILFVATRQATEPVTFVTARPTLAPTPLPTPVRTATPAPTQPPRTPSPSPSRTASPRPTP